MDIRNVFAQAMKAQAQNQPDVARILYQKILAFNAALPEVHFQLGRLEMTHGTPKQALKHLKNAQKLKPGQAEIWLLMMDAHLANKDKKSATALVKTAAKRKLPKPLVAKLLEKSKTGGKGTETSATRQIKDLFDAASAQFQSGDFERAKSTAEQIVALKPDFAHAYAIIGTSLAQLGRSEEAYSNLDKAVSLKPDYFEAYIQYAQILLSQNKGEDALKRAQQALVLQPAAPSALETMAYCLQATGQSKAALTYFEKRETSAAPKTAVYEMQYGDTLMHLNRPSDALVRFHAALELGPEQLEPYLKIAEAHIELGDSEEGLRWLGKAEEKWPEEVSVKRALVNYHKNSGNFDAVTSLTHQILDQIGNDGVAFRTYTIGNKIKEGDATVARMQKAFDDGDIVEGTKASMAFGLAKAMEDTKQFQTAFQYIKIGNDVLKEDHPVGGGDDIAFESNIRHLAELGIGGDPLRSDQNRLPKMIFITGMPRSGTTLTEQIVSSHSTVTGGGELGLIQPPLRDLISVASAAERALTYEELGTAGRTALNDYKDLHPTAEILTDKALMGFDTAGFVRAALPNSKMVVVRRDPRDNCLSMYKNMFTPGTQRYTTDLRELGKRYVRALDQIRFWHEQDPDLMYELRYEDLIGNPEEEARKLIDACGLEWEDQCMEFYKNARTVKTLSVYQVRQPIYSSSVGAWKRYEDELQPLIEVLEEGGALEEYRDV